MMMLPTDEHIANLKKVEQSGSPRAKAFVTFPKWFVDQTQWDDPALFLLMCHKMGWEAPEGHETYLERLKKVRPPVTPNSRNDSRQEAYFWPVIYYHVKPYLSEGERKEWENILQNWAAAILNFTRLGDSDELVGHYLGLVMIDKVLESNYLAKTEECEPDLVPHTKWKEEIETFIRRSEGGCWIEGTEYNLNTVILLCNGVALLGLDYFVGFRRWLPQLAEYLRYALLDDFSDGEQHGDIQSSAAHNPEWHYRLPLMCQVLHLIGNNIFEGEDKALADEHYGPLFGMVREFTKNINDPYYGLYNYWMGLGNSMWMFNPSWLDDIEVVYSPARGALCCSGVGLILYKSDNAYVQFKPGNPTLVDHDGVWAGGFGDLRVWYKGQWVIDHPLGYQASQEAFNTCRPGGLTYMFHRKFGGFRRFVGGFESYGEMWTPYQIPGKHEILTFLESWRRTVVVNEEPEGLVVVVIDKFEQKNPPAPFAQRWFLSPHYTYDQAQPNKVTINGAALHCPAAQRVAFGEARVPHGETDYPWIDFITDVPTGELITKIVIGKPTEVPQPQPQPEPQPQPQPQPNPLPKVLAVYELGDETCIAYEDRLDIVRSIPKKANLPTR